MYITHVKIEIIRLIRVSNLKEGLFKIQNGREPKILLLFIIQCLLFIDKSVSIPY